MSNESPKFKLDLYEMLYWFRIYWRPRGKGHITTVIAESAGIKPKTFKRTLYKTEYKHKLDVLFWREKGSLSKEDLKWLQDMSTQNIFKNIRPIVYLPKNIRKIHPDYLEFIIAIIAFQQGFAQSHIDCPPLLNIAVKFVITTTIHISEIIFALIKKDYQRYDKSVNRLQLRLPITFPKDQIWEEFASEPKVDKSVRCFFKELLLLGILCFDMVYVTWEIAGPKKYISGQSALMGAFQELSMNKKPLRERFFQDIKKIVQQKQIDKSKDVSDQTLYSLLAGNNPGQIEAIKKQCTRIRRNKYPTPKDLDDFLRKCFSVLAKNEPYDQDEDEAIRFSHYHRNLFAHYFMVDEVKHEYISPETDTSYSVLLDKLIKYGRWLQKEIFHCPVPA